MGTLDFRPALEQAERSVAELHASPHRLVVYATGAGAGVQSLLWEQPGASATLLDAQFPYSRDALMDLLGAEPQQYCSQETAIRMAIAAHARCRELAIRSGKPDVPTTGLGLTASVATGTPKRGDHHVHIAVQCQFPEFQDAVIMTIDGTFTKGRLTREEEGTICDLLALIATFYTVGLQGEHILLPSWGDFGFKSQEVSLGEFEGPWVVNP
ncbi:MAG: hypothetical protein Q7R80_03115, partial [bacterium]|nr:hypothetical protein [bacterium]